MNRNDLHEKALSAAVNTAVAKRDAIFIGLRQFIDNRAENGNPLAIYTMAAAARIDALAKAKIKGRK